MRSFHAGLAASALLLYATLAAGQSDLCPAKIFLAECSLSDDKSEAGFFHPNPVEPWRRCVPSHCAPYPFPNHAILNFLVGREGTVHAVGDKLTVSCQHGYKLESGNTSITSNCTSSCEWSLTERCLRMLQQHCGSMII
eukprot:246900-Rhodomonas_salina.2